MIKKRTIKNKVKLNALLFFTLFTLSIAVIFIELPKNKLYNDATSEDLGVIKNPIKSSAYAKDFVHINGNWTITNSTYAWCKGSGVYNDPYIIENLTIDGGASSYTTGILIENSQNRLFYYSEYYNFWI